MGRRVSVGSVSVGSVARAVEWSVPSRRVQARQRLVALVGAVGGDDASGLSTRELVSRAAAYLAEPTPAKLWFTLAVLHARYPLSDDVIEAARSIRLDGPASMILSALFPRRFTRFVPALPGGAVEVVRDSVLVDVDHTSTVEFATGIQRVVRETVKRWVRDHDTVLVGWTREKDALRRMSEAEQQTALTGLRTPSDGAGASSGEHENIIVPLGGAYVLPELTLDRRVALRLASLGETSQTTCSVIGYDAVPLSSSETSDFMVSGGFANNLAAVKYMDRVAAISEAAADEYRGWRSMLVGSGVEGPVIEALPLPHEPPTSVALPLDEAETGLKLIPGMPLVLCVGSHEPRKNHLAVLQAAEGLWREGHSFQMLFVGGNAWNSGLFTAKLSELIETGRPISNVRALSDELLWAAYRLASFTVFPSLNEGYGLPIAESLSAGTPVVTSNYGSMLEITSTGGAVYVDPREDESIMAGMRRLLVDEDFRVSLQKQAGLLPVRTWDEYADEAWHYLVDG